MVGLVPLTIDGPTVKDFGHDPWWPSYPNHYASHLQSPRPERGC